MANGNSGPTRTPDKHSIENITSAVFDNGRRGAPKPGCDCVQCFGYCMVDAEQAMRQGFAVAEQHRQAAEVNASIVDVVRA